VKYISNISWLLFTTLFCIHCKEGHAQVLVVEHLGNDVVAELNAAGALKVSGELVEHDNHSDAGNLIWQRSNGETYDSKLVFSSSVIKVKSTVVTNNITNAETGNLIVDASQDPDLPTTHLDGDAEFDGTLSLRGAAIDGGIPYAAVAYLDRDVFEMNSETNGFKNQYSSLHNDVRINNDASSYFHVNDHLGSARMVIDGEFTIAEATAYHAYGKMEKILLAPDKMRQNFTEKEYDDDGGVALIEIDVQFTNVEGINASTRAELIIEITQAMENDAMTIPLNRIGNALSKQTQLAFVNELEIVSIAIRVNNVTNDILYILDMSGEHSMEQRTVSIGDIFSIEALCDISAIPEIPNQETPFTDIAQPRILDNAAKGDGEFFAGIGQFYFGARYYDADIGRWTTTDPAEEFWDLYNYVGGNPVAFFDPVGLEKAYFLWSFSEEREQTKDQFNQAKDIYKSWNDEIKTAIKKYGEGEVYVKGPDNPATLKDFNKAFTDQEALSIVTGSHGWETGGLELSDGNSFFPEDQIPLPNLQILVLEGCYQGNTISKALWMKHLGLKEDQIIAWKSGVFAEDIVKFNKKGPKDPWDNSSLKSSLGY